MYIAIQVLIYLQEINISIAFSLVSVLSQFLLFF